MMKIMISQFYVARPPVDGRMMVLTAKKATTFMPSPGVLLVRMTPTGLTQQLDQDPWSSRLAPKPSHLRWLVFDMLSPNHRGLKSLNLVPGIFI
jgi:hypothetical protein